MSGRLQFREKLSGILELGNEKQKILKKEEVEEYFAEDCLSEEQMELVYDYLLSQKIAVTGYVKRGGTVREAGMEEEQALNLTEEDRQYLEGYIKEISMLQPQNEKEEKLQYYFPKVVKIAEELYSEEYLIEDLIQEGNVGLMLAIETDMSETAVLENVRQSIQMFIEEHEETKSRDRKMIEKVTYLDECVKNLTEELKRKPTLDELASYMELTEDEVNDILRLTGEDEEDV